MSPGGAPRSGARPARDGELSASRRLFPILSLIAGLLAALTALYVLLGFALDGISMVVLTSAVVQPMIRQAGIDPIRFGVYIVLMSQIAELTPPVGFPMFVMQMFTGRDLLYISRAALPFFFLLLLGTAIITVFPGIATYLPAKMLDR